MLHHVNKTKGILLIVKTQTIMKLIQTSNVIPLNVIEDVSVSKEGNEIPDIIRLADIIYSTGEV